MDYKFLLLIINLLHLSQYTFSASLDAVTDEELTNLIRTEKYVIVLFCKYLVCMCLLQKRLQLFLFF